LALREVKTELLNVEGIPVMVPLSKAARSHPSGHPVAAAVLRYAIKGMTSILEIQRSSLKQNITAGGGSWPPTNSELVAKHLNAFSRFIKSIDFNELQ